MLTWNSRCRERGSVWVPRLTAACPPLPFLGLEHAVFKETSPQAIVRVSWDCISEQHELSHVPVAGFAPGNGQSLKYTMKCRVTLQLVQVYMVPRAKNCTYLHKYVYLSFYI